MIVSVCGLALRDADLLSPAFAQALRKQVCAHLFGAEVNANRDDGRRPADVFVRTDMSFADFLHDDGIVGGSPMHPCSRV